MASEPVKPGAEAAPEYLPALRRLGRGRRRHLPVRGGSGTAIERIGDGCAASLQGRCPAT